MGRGKMEMKRIEKSTNRQVTYSKRRVGLIKKAMEISVLCDAKISLVIFSSTDKMHEYCSPNSSVVDILEFYQSQSGQRLWDAKHEDLSNEIDRVKKENDNLKIELRHLRGEDITGIHHQDLIRMEDALSDGLSAVRDRQMEIWKAHQKNGTMLEEENKGLNYVYHQKQQMGMEVNMKGMENSGYMIYDQEKEYNMQQMPFGFKVQPIQPNLQQRM